MKKFVSGLLVIVLLAGVFSSCKKAKEALGITTATWHIGTNTYTASVVTRVGTTQIIAEGSDGNSMQVFFTAIPTAGNTYKVVAESKVPANTLASNEMAVEFNVGASDVYLSTGTDNVYATVSVDTEGTLTIDVPTIAVEHFAGAGSLGTTTADGHIED